MVPILMEGLLGNFQPRKRLLTNLKKNNFLEQDQFTTLIFCSAPKNFFIPRANMGVCHLDSNSATCRHTKILKLIIILSSFVHAFLKETFSLKVILKAMDEKMSHFLAFKFAQQKSRQVLTEEAGVND